jgi:cysteine desulfurase/selenocysteine lyase
VISVMEHHSNIVPWHFLRERKGAVLKWLDVDDDGGVDLAALEALIAHDKGAPVLLDGCQAAVHGRVDVSVLDVDYYAFTGHKLYGPTGIGVLYGKAERLAELPPFEGGGEMIDTVARETVTYNDPPHRFEAGTPPILEAIGLGAAIDWIAAQDRAAIEAHENVLRDRAMEALGALNWLSLHGRARDKGAIVSFSMEGAHPHDVAQILDRQGVAVRAGHHCAQVLMERLGVTATARASFACYNTLEEIDVLVEALHKARKMLA